MAKLKINELEIKADVISTADVVVEKPEKNANLVWDEKIKALAAEFKSEINAVKKAQQEVVVHDSSHEIDEVRGWLSQFEIHSLDQIQNIKTEIKHLKQKQVIKPEVKSVTVHKDHDSDIQKLDKDIRLLWQETQHIHGKMERAIKILDRKKDKTQQVINLCLGVGLLLALTLTIL